MADLLPSIPDATVSDEAEPRVVGLEDEAAEDVLGALSSTTARECFAALNEEPCHPSALADRVDTSLQNVQYHLAKLEDAGMIEVVDTAYSEKGREMDVYAPADRPLVVFAGDDDDQSLLNQALGRLLGGVGAIAGMSLAVRGLVGSEETTTPVETGSEPLASGGSGSGSDAGGIAAADSGDTGGDGSAPPDGADDATESGTETTMEIVDPDSFNRNGQYTFDATNISEIEADVSPAGETVAGSGQPVSTVEPASHELSWIVEPLAATGLPPSLAVAVLGTSLLAGGLAAWVWRERQKRL